MDVNTSVHLLKSQSLPDDELTTWLRKINDNISFLNRDNENIVDLILKLNWTGRSEDVRQSYSELVLNLVTAYSVYLKPVLRMIIKYFIPSIDDEDHDINTHVHLLLQSMCRLIPSMSTLLMVMLADSYPYMRKGVEVQIYYVKNLFHLTTYLPNTRSAILELVVIKLLQIDVHCPRDVILQFQDQEGPSDCDSIFVMENDTRKDDNQYSLANTLDILIKEVLLYIKESCYLRKQSDTSDGQLNWEAMKRIYKELLTVFDAVILPTHDCAHVQFVMFYICSFRHLLCEGFTDYLWKKVLNPNLSSVIRQACACYIGSLLARAKYVPIRMVQDCLVLMCNWVNGYIDNQSGASYTYADAVHHSTFYAVCQAVFYLVTFRHQEMVYNRLGRQILQELNLERIVNCRLNPLRICQPVVVKNFATVARNYQIAYCYTIIERNSRLFLPENNSVSCTEMSSFTTLETFFPFDPYLLSRSGEIIQPLYREYEGHQETMQVEKEHVDESIDTGVFGSSHQSSLPDLLHHGSSPGYRQYDHITPKFC